MGIRVRRPRVISAVGASLVLALLLVVAQAWSAGAALKATGGPVPNWREVSKETFVGLEGIHRQQGVATDGRSMYFTYNSGVIRTKLDGTTIEAENLDAIPDELKALGSGHIGDPDVYKGKLLLPIENDGFSHPFIAIFNAKNLQYTGVKYAVPGGGVDPQIDGHIGWIAVDPERGYAYYSNWTGAGTDVLRVLDLNDFSFVKNVQLSQMVEHNQGAAVYNGILYASQDVYPEYPILAINPDTGFVQTVFNRNFPPFVSGGSQSKAEAEGLAILDTGKCVAMYVIEVAGAGGLSLRGYTPNGVPIPKKPGTRPRITGLNLKPGRVRRGKTTQMRFKISRPASATVRISRYKAGSDPCAKTRTLGVVSKHQIKKGKARLRIRTRIKGRKLAPGAYQLSLTATDRAGNINDSKKSILSIVR